MKQISTSGADELDRCGHLYSDELREYVIKHYVQKFHDHGGQATHCLSEAKSWVGGTAGATTRQEKVEIMDRIRKAHTLMF